MALQLKLAVPYDQAPDFVIPSLSFAFFWFLSVCRHIIVLVLYSCFLLIENSKHKINVRPLPEID